MTKAGKVHLISTLNGLFKEVYGEDIENLIYNSVLFDSNYDPVMIELQITSLKGLKEQLGITE